MLEPEVKMCFVKFWSEMYHAVRSNEINEAINRLVQENNSLEETVKMLEEAVQIKPVNNGSAHQEKYQTDEDNGRIGPL